jgi:hypothetical protein
MCLSSALYVCIYALYIFLAVSSGVRPTFNECRLIKNVAAAAARKVAVKQRSHFW